MTQATIIRERNVSLDIFRLVMSLLVVTIHAPLSASLPGWLLSNGIARVAVPCFFIVNGYYFEQQVRDAASLWRYVRHLALIYLVWMAVYFPFCYTDVITGQRALWRVVVFGYEHLWYILALIQGSIALFLLRKITGGNILLCLVFFAMIACGWFCSNILGLGLNATRLSLAAFIIAGSVIFRMNMVSKVRFNLYTVAIFVFGIAALLVDSYMAREFYGTKLDVSLALMVVCPLLFILVMQRGRMASTDKFVANLATAIYFVHPLLIKTLGVIFGFTGLALYLPTVFLSLMLGAVVVELNKRLKIFL